MCGGEGGVESVLPFPAGHCEEFQHSKLQGWYFHVI